MEFIQESICETVEFKIYIAGDYHRAAAICENYCLKGLCVTVQELEYIYTFGREKGVCIGLINYPRFPASEKEIEKHAIELGKNLIEGLHQGSFSVVGPNKTLWFSRKE